MATATQPSQSFQFCGRSFLAFVLRPEIPISRWMSEADTWLSRSPGFFAGKPVVLVCLHHGPVHLLRYFLRSRGVAAAMVVLESRAERSPVREWKDSLSPPTGVPNVFCRDELKAMQRHMQAGGCLLVAADYGRGKMYELPFGSAKVQVAAGAFRVAEMVGATVFPVTVEETQAWRFRVSVGPGHGSQLVACHAYSVTTAPGLARSALSKSAA